MEEISRSEREPPPAHTAQGPRVCRRLPRAFRSVPVRYQGVTNSVADPGCLSRIPDPTFFHPGSELSPSRIPVPGSASKNLSILTPKKWFLSSRKYDPGCSSRIPDLDADFLPIPDPGSRGQRNVVYLG